MQYFFLYSRTVVLKLYTVTESVLEKILKFGGLFFWNRFRTKLPSNFFKFYLTHAEAHLGRGFEGQLLFWNFSSIC